MRVLGQKSQNHLDILHSYTLIRLLRQLKYWFLCQHSNLNETLCPSIFPYLIVKRIWPTQSHHLNNHGSFGDQCYLPSFTAISPLVPEKKIFKGVLPYMGVLVILVIDLDGLNILSFSDFLEALKFLTNGSVAF